MAPGCHVDSTIPDFAGGYDFQLVCGTSMAAPQVSGAAALFTQYYRRLPGVTGDPSPALVKAALLAVARDLHGTWTPTAPCWATGPTASRAGGDSTSRRSSRRPRGA